VTPLTFIAAALGLSVLAGLLGSLLGLGGGIIVIPALTQLLGIDIKYAIGASIVSVIATSSGAAAAYVRNNIANLRVAMFLELGTASGALCGAFIAGFVSGRWLYLMFAVLVALASVAMWMKGEGHAAAPKPDRIADALRLHAVAHDDPLAPPPYRVSRSGLGFVVSIFAGILSGLLGIGGGIIKVPAMTLAMGMPLKASTATSNLMIGVTAAASAGVYFARGEIDPFVTGPVTIGVLIGSALGAISARHIDAKYLRIAFTAVLVIVAVQMVRKGLGQ
jgi:uncharacterized membrane protein YfcA